MAEEKKTVREKNMIKELLLKHIKSDHIIDAPEMSGYTSFKAGGNALFMAEPQNEAELLDVLAELRNGGIRHFVMGNGTNFVVADEGFDGVILRLGGAFNEIALLDQNTMQADAGASLSMLAKAALKYDLSGLEFATGIPGSIGGAIYMNAGAYGGEIKDVLAGVRILDIRSMDIRYIDASDLNLGYRYSALHDSGDVVLSGSFSLEKAEHENIAAAMSDYVSRRNAKQPVGSPSGGSFFKRPEGHYAGALIERAGLKGMSIGGARVSPLHAGFIVNAGGATAADIEALAKLVQNTVYDKFGVLLEPEVKILR